MLAILLPDEAVSIEAFIELLHEDIVVPAHCATEVGNGLLVAHRRGRITRDEMMAILSDTAAFRVDIDMRERFGVAAGAIELALAHKLTVYGAAYLELARRRRLPLATFDGALRAAAVSEGVSLFETQS